MVNVALLSKWHVHAIDYAKEAQQNKHICIKMVWDEDAPRGEKWAKELEVPFESRLESVLSSPEIDAVIVATPTNLHKEVIIAAANHKKHIFTEKVLALTVADCDAIFAAVKKNVVELMVSLPRLTENYTLYAEQAIHNGLLGDITTIRCRAAHDGAVPKENNKNGWLPDHFYHDEMCGGGAFIDLGAHPIYLLNRLAGSPKAVTARLQSGLGKEVDLNAVAIVEYKSGVLGIMETSFLSGGSPFQLQVYGTEGTLLIEDRQIRIRSSKLGDDWIVPDKLPDNLPMPMEQWINAIKGIEIPRIYPDDFRNLTVINEAAALSNSYGRRIVID